MRWIALSLLLTACTANDGATSSASPTSGDDDETTDSDITSDTATTETSLPTSFDEAFRRVDDAPEGTMWGGADVAIADDGTVLISWVDERTTERLVYLVRSDDFGETFGPSMAVPTEGNPVAQPWTQPTLNIVGDTVGITAMEWIPGPQTRGFGYTADLSDLAFGPGVQGPDNTIEVVHGGLDPNGDLWLAWIDYPPGGATVYFSNPGTGYVERPMVFDGLPGNACPCCPISLIWTAAGEPVIAWRHNVNDIRNMVVATGAPGAYTLANAVFATSTDWFIIGCPANGPHLFEYADTTLAMSWSDSSSGSPLVYLTTSSDGGATWSPEHIVAPNMDEPQLNPVVHESQSGDIYVGIHSTNSMPVAISTDGGASFADPIELVTPDGALDWIEYANGAGMTVVVGQTTAGSIWYKRIE